MTAAIALDILSEARSRRWVVALWGLATLVLLLVALGLRLDVVDGALAASRLFGKDLRTDIRAADVALRPLFLAVSYLVFYGGLVLGVVATADFAPMLLAPGRVENLVHQGLHGRLYVPRPTPEARPGAGQDHVALWRDQLLLWGPRADLEAALERLERHGEEDPLPIPEGMTYGEAYGVVPGVTLGRLFTGTQADLGRRLGTLADRVELNLDAARDVAVIARVQGREAEQLDDLGRSFGSVLSLARFAARSRGDEGLAALLEHARIVPGRSGFSMELLLPIELVERWLGSCGAVPASGSAGRQSPPATRR